MTVKIYVEGGGDNKDTRVRCRRGFAEYCNKLAPTDHQPSIVVCGGRQQAFDRFRTDSQRGEQKNDLRALLVDSEGPIGAQVAPATHLLHRDGWDFTDLPTEKVFLMVQAMEAWFLADRSALVSYYGTGFRLNSLPGDERHVEAILKQDLEPSLVSASVATKTKKSYHKTKHAFDLLVEIDPAKVEAGSPHAARFHAFLRSL